MIIPSVLVPLLISSVLSSGDDHSCASNYPATVTVTAMPSITSSDSSSTPTGASPLPFGRKIEMQPEDDLGSSAAPPMDTASSPERNKKSQMESPANDSVQLPGGLETVDEPTSANISSKDASSASSTATSLPNLYGYDFKEVLNEKNSASKLDTIFTDAILAVLYFTVF